MSSPSAKTPPAKSRPTASDPSSSTPTISPSDPPPPSSTELPRHSAAPLLVSAASPSPSSLPPIPPRSPILSPPASPDTPLPPRPTTGPRTHPNLIFRQIFKNKEVTDQNAVIRGTDQRDAKHAGWDLDLVFSGVWAKLMWCRAGVEQCPCVARTSPS